MARVTIVTSKGRQRMPAKQAVQRIEAGDARLDRSDEAGVKAMEAYLVLRRVPLNEPAESSVPEPTAKPARKNAAAKKKGSVKKSTKKTGR